MIILDDNQNKSKDSKYKKTKPNYAHCFLVIINFYLVMCLLLFSYFVVNIYCSTGITFTTIFHLSDVLKDSEIYASLLDVIVILMKNPGTVLGFAIMFILLILSLLNHAFNSNVISLLSMIMIGVNVVFIFVMDTSYKFWDEDYGSFFGMNLPELDVIMVIILIPLFILFLVNFVKRR